MALALISRSKRPVPAPAKPAPKNKLTRKPSLTETQHRPGIRASGLQAPVSTPMSVVQTKLTVGEPGDKFEQEADRVADEVMRMSDNAVLGVDSSENRVPGSGTRAGSAPSSIQRMCAECAEEEGEKLQRTPLSNTSAPPRISALTGRVSARVELPNQVPALQRQEMEDEEELLQTKTEASAAPAMKPGTETLIHSLQGRGQALPPATRAYFEPRFGRDFSQVRVHTDARASESAKTVNALAYTVGQEVVFRAGQYTPGTSQGRRLLAHELTHVIQQGHASAESPARGNVARTSLEISRAPSAAVIQRAQVGRVHPGTDGGNPFFIYELDSSIRTFSQLAVHYGVGTASIQSANPAARPTALRLGQQLKVPAVDPPAENSRSTGAGEPGLIQSTRTVPVRVRWNANSNSNLVGRIPRGTSIGLIDSGADIPVAALQDKAQGILDELTLRGLAGPTTVFAFPPTSNVRSTLTPISSSEVNLIARMIWGEQRSQGTNAMVAAAWIARNRFDAGWGSYSSIITQSEFHGLASPSDVTGLTGPDLERWTEAQQIAQEVVHGVRADPTGGVVYFGNGNSVRDRMRACARGNAAFTWNQIAGTNFFFSNGDYTSSSCGIP